MVAAIIVATAMWLFVAQALPLHAPIDDAFISFRYARNLTEGTGLVYNPGEYVEGITNLLWTLWSRPALRSVSMPSTWRSLSRSWPGYRSCS